MVRKEQSISWKRDSIQRSTKVTLWRKRKQRKEISNLKENRQAGELFVERYPEKHEAFKYLLTTFPIAIFVIERELY